MNQPISRENPLVLASASPRRRRLLEQVAIPFLVMASEVDEELPAENPERTARLLAEKKALAVWNSNPSAWVLGADTVVVINRFILGKPAERGEAVRMLQSLAARTHRVITGMGLVDPEGKVAHSEAVVTHVRFRPLQDAEIDAYVDTGEPFGKAGSYAIQGIGAFLVEEIRGSYTNVVGLPLCALIKALVKVGAIKSFPVTV